MRLLTTHQETKMKLSKAILSSVFRTVLKSRYRASMRLMHTISVIEKQNGRGQIDLSLLSKNYLRSGPLWSYCPPSCSQWKFYKHIRTVLKSGHVFSLAWNNFYWEIFPLQLVNQICLSGKLKEVTKYATLSCCFLVTLSNPTPSSWNLLRAATFSTVPQCLGQLPKHIMLLMNQ